MRPFRPTLSGGLWNPARGEPELCPPAPSVARHNDSAEPDRQRHGKAEKSRCGAQPGLTHGRHRLSCADAQMGLVPEGARPLAFVQILAEHPRSGWLAEWSMRDEHTQGRRPDQLPLAHRSQVVQVAWGSAIDPGPQLGGEGIGGEDPKPGRWRV